MQRMILMLASLALWLPLAGHACTQTNTGGVLPSVTTQRVANGPAMTGTASFSYACSGVLGSIAGNAPSLQGRIQSATTGLTLKNASSSVQIPYEIFSDPTLTTGYASGSVLVSLNGQSLLSLFNGGRSASVPLYIRTLPGPNLRAGVYTDTVTLTWQPRSICEGLLEVGNLCVGTYNNVDVIASIIITLTVSNDCTITAPTVNFGSAPILAGFPTVSQSISLQCSRDLVYTVGLSNGSSPNAGRRRMSAGSARLAYDLFKADTTVWGSVGAARASGPAPATGNTVQTIPYTARIYQDQGAPALGTYTDNVVVDVQF
jgi:spore coat protein U-like protein